MDSEETLVLDILFILYKGQIRSYNNVIILSIITTSELALLVKHSAKSWILDLSIILYIYYNINLFNYIAPTSTKIA